MTYFVTGGTSSIGKVLVKELSARGEQVRLLARKTSNLSGILLPGVQVVYGDVADKESIECGMKGCDRVCHLAAVVGANVPEEQWWKVNRDGAKNVLETAVKMNVESVVMVSSLSVLLPTQAGETADESRVVDPSKYFNLYQKTKRAADDLARQFYKDKGLSVKIVYPGYGYGCSFAASHPGMTDQILLRLASGQPTAIMGSGKNKIMIAYYKDTANGILLAHEHGIAGDDYILGNGNFTLPEIWQTTAKILGKEPPKRRMPIPLLKAINFSQKILKGQAPFPQDFFDMIGRDWCFSNEKAKRILHFEPRSFEQTMAETWEEYLQQKEETGAQT